MNIDPEIVIALIVLGVCLGAWQLVRIAQRREQDEELAYWLMVREVQMLDAAERDRRMGRD